MSRENTMNPMTEMLLKMLLGGEAPKSEPKAPETPPTETKGFESLVTAEEYEAIVKLKEAMDNYIDVHNKGVIERIQKRDTSLMDSYASIQYLLLSDMIEDAMQALGAMYNIHTLDKDVIDEAVKDCGTTLKEFEKKLVFDAMMKKMKG